ncbi:MAG: PP2C family protein-serine/threonine phosphatase [Alicyclobacillaceae bacterium]|nr:PP2C family protein-serine/threonine phosphatase [Alicyclobacillaceae bacterium]
MKRIVKDKLIGEFVLLFLKISGIGAIVSAVGLMNGDSWQYMIRFDVWMIFLSMAGFIISFAGLVQFRFGRLFHLFQTGAPAGAALTPDEITRCAGMCLRLPFALFRGFLGFGVVYAAFYLVTEWWVNRTLLHYRGWDWIWFFKNFLFKAGLVWLLALMLYNGTRRILRPILAWLAESSPVGLGVSMSLRRRLVGVSVSLTVMMGMQYIYLQLGQPDSSRVLPGLLGFFVLFLILSYLFVRSAVDDTIRDIDQVRTSLAQFNRMDFPHSLQRLKVNSADEVGDLKIQFNALQEKTERHYRVLSRDLALAHRVQASLLPPSPLRAGSVIVQGRSVSAADLGGDFYDFAPVDDHTVAVIIGDVAGKGPPAALVTATVLGLFRAEIRHGGSPGEWLRRINGSISDVLSLGLYVTAAVLTMDVRSGRYRYAGAGHLPPLCISENGTREWETASLPLGLGIEQSFEELSGTIADGECLVFYTDGVLEAKSPDGKIVGFDTLYRWAEAAYRAPADILDWMTAALETHRGCASRLDDETIVVLRYGARGLTEPFGQFTVSQVR